MTLTRGFWSACLPIPEGIQLSSKLEISNSRITFQIPESRIHNCYLRLHVSDLGFQIPDTLFENSDSRFQILGLKNQQHVARQMQVDTHAVAKAKCIVHDDVPHCKALSIWSM